MYLTYKVMLMSVNCLYNFLMLGACIDMCLASCFPFCYRTGKNGYIQIDGGAELSGQSKGRSLMVNTKGSIYLGG